MTPAPDPLEYLETGGSRQAPEQPGDACCAERLLLTERAVLVPLLRGMDTGCFARPTACQGWTIREVVAHCAAALTRIADGTAHDFCPVCNQEDVDERCGWSLDQIIDELDVGYQHAGALITASQGCLDVIALGEWVHGGDVRDALGIAPAYAAEGIDDALALLAVCSRLRGTPALTAHLQDRQLELGSWLPNQDTRAELATDIDTLVRLYTGRPRNPGNFSLTGASPADLIIYR